MRGSILLSVLVAASSLSAQAPKAADPKPTEAPKAKPVRRGPAVDPGKVAQAVNDRFAQAMAAGDLAAVLAAYTEDAELHMSKKDVFKGHAEIKGHLEGFLKATPVKAAKVTSTFSHRLGNTITDTGTWSFEVEDKGQRVTMGGTYVQLLWRGKDGVWRIHRDHPFMAGAAK